VRFERAACEPLAEDTPADCMSKSQYVDFRSQCWPLLVTSELLVVQQDRAGTVLHIRALVEHTSHQVPSRFVKEKSSCLALNHAFLAITNQSFSWFSNWIAHAFLLGTLL